MGWKPTWRINSIYQLSPEVLTELGYQAVIVDLDNTLIASHVDYATEEMVSWIMSARAQGLKLYIISNNRPQRVGRILESLALPFTANALKPRKYAFKQALTYFSLPKERVIVIGDQVLTDLIGAKRMGLDIILVKPLVKKDNIYTWFNRWIERMIYKLIGIDRHSDWGSEIERK